MNSTFVEIQMIDGLLSDLVHC